jgi:putative transposase
MGTRAGVPHLARPDHKARHPVHVTLRAARRLPSLRRQGIFLELRRAFGCYCAGRFRVVHFSVQTDHVHLLVEAADKEALSRGARGLSIRLARAVNRVLRRRGPVWGDRYHARPLRTPREMRLALVYVLMNWRKHVPRSRGFDPYASAHWFDGWRRGTRLPLALSPPYPAPVAPSRTWLGSLGWRRHGLVDVREKPKGGSRAAGHAVARGRAVHSERAPALRTMRTPSARHARSTSSESGVPRSARDKLSPPYTSATSPMAR